MTLDSTPRTVLTRPALLLAILVLALNDHLLKAVFPGLLTGKLSDVSGLFAFPLVAWAGVDLLRRDERGVSLRWLAVACFVTGALFSLLKLVAPVRAAFLAGYAWFGIEAGVSPDATDLLCLPMLALAWAYGAWHLRRPAPPPARPRLVRAARLGVVGVMVVLTVATSVPPGDVFVRDDADPMIVSVPLPGVKLLGAQLAMQPGTGGIVFYDDPIDRPAFASVVLRWPLKGPKPKALVPYSCRALLGRSVWRGVNGAVHRRVEHKTWVEYRFKLQLDPTRKAPYRSGSIHVLVLALTLSDGRDVELLCPLR